MAEGGYRPTEPPQINSQIGGNDMVKEKSEPKKSDQEPETKPDDPKPEVKKDKPANDSGFGVRITFDDD